VLMRVQVLYFASSREAAGTSSQELELPSGATTGALRAALLAAHPALTDLMGSCVLAVNQEYVAPDTEVVLRDGDEIALIPPLSGG
jgi:molybdopterin converting factor subunit 1